MKSILHILYLGVQILRLILSACIVTPAVLLITGAKRNLSNLDSAALFFFVYIFWVFAFIALNRIVPVIKRCKRQDYFAEANSSSIRFLAYVLIIYALGVPILKFILMKLEDNRLEIDDVLNIEYGFVSQLALGFVLFLLAKIVDRGRALEVDHKLTI